MVWEVLTDFRSLFALRKPVLIEDLVRCKQAQKNCDGRHAQGGNPNVEDINFRRELPSQ